MRKANWVATAHSTRPYYPMLLSNGNDAVLINYSGSMVSALTGHSHYEQHQGSPCAWYRISHSGRMNSSVCLQPIIQSGYQVIVDGEVCEPSDYRQEFDPREAVLKTVTESWGVVLELETFLTDESILVERYRVLKAPRNSELVVFVRSTDGSTGGLRAPHSATVKTVSTNQRRMDFAYELDGIRGVGAMVCDQEGKRECSRVEGLRFSDLRRGWTLTRYTVISDNTQCGGYRQKTSRTVARIEQEGYARIRSQHAMVWREYSRRNRITVPDREMQYLYDFSIYSLRGNQHPDTGAIVCGMLPFLWGGGVVCPYDASYSHRAFLCSNRIEQARRHAGFHLSRRKQGKRDAESLGLHGAVYSGWTNYEGKHRGGDFRKYVMHYKPLMAAFLVIDYYSQWEFAPEDKIDRRYVNAMREILDLAIENFVLEQGEVAIMRPCIAGNESDIEVQNDTFNSLVYARALKAYAEMARECGIEDAVRYQSLSERLYRGLEDNFRDDGVLLPWKGAKYLTGLQLQFYLWNLPEGISPQGVREALVRSRTPWGFDADQPSERYRDWPWVASRAAIALAHMSDPKESFEQLSQFPKDASALGAIPEKIRIDGYPIGYWYSTPYAIFVWAMNDAFCHDGPDENVRLLWGLDGTWEDAKFENIRLGGGILASGRIQNKKLVELRLKNTGGRTVRRRIDLNPIYGCEAMPDSIEIKPGKAWRLK